MRSIVPAVLGVTCLLGTATADSLTDLMGPREIAVGEGMRGGATGASAIGLNPAGLPLNKELVFEGGYGWRGTDDATLIGVSACDSTNAAPGCFFYDYLGSNPELGGMQGTRTTHVGGMALSKLLLPRVMVGATVKYYSFKSDMAGEMKQSGFTADFGATLRLTQMINVGLAGMNLYNTEEKHPMVPRAVGGGFHARPMPNLALGFDARWLLDAEDVSSSIRYGGGAELCLSGSRGQTGYPIRAGALRDEGLGATFVSGGIGMSTLKLSIDLAVSREVKGGDESMALASMRFWGPREAAPTLDTTMAD
jgi:hypothetical protein